MTLKEAIYKCLDVYLAPQTPGQIKDWINRNTDHNVSENNIATRLSEMATDPKYCVRGDWHTAENGNRYKRWYIPRATQQEAQQEMF